MRLTLLLGTFAAALLPQPRAAFAQAGPLAPTTAPATAAAPVPPPKVPLPPGMTPLFDGKTLNGWVQAPADAWAVKDGVIASLGAGRGV